MEFELKLEFSTMIALIMIFGVSNIDNILNMSIRYFEITSFDQKTLKNVHFKTRFILVVQ